MRYLRLSRKFSLTSGLLLLALLLWGCEQSSPLDANSDMSDNVVQTNVGKATILSLKNPVEANQVLFKPGGDSSLFYVVKEVKESKDTKLEVGEGASGKSKVEFKKHSVNTDMQVILNWAEDNTYSGYLLPEDSTLNSMILGKPVKVKLSYKRADMIGVNEADFGLYWLDPKSNTWINQNASFKYDKFELEFETDRFGQWALFRMDNGVLKDVYKLDANVFYSKKRIEAKKGGKIELGTKETGTTKIEFKKNDLPEDLTIEFEWAAGGTLDGLLNALEFGPHGSQFNSPVKVEISYEMADLTGINEDNLIFIYFNEDLQEWELIPSKVDKEKEADNGISGALFSLRGGALIANKMNF